VLKAVDGNEIPLDNALFVEASLSSKGRLDWKITGSDSPQTLGYIKAERLL